MTKNEVKTLAAKYGMEIVRHYITREGRGVRCESENAIPELDALADSRDAAIYPCAVEREWLAGTEYRYTIYCPTSWFDLWGWADCDEED